jgi:hypothetical protein
MKPAQLFPSLTLVHLARERRVDASLKNSGPVADNQPERKSSETCPKQVLPTPRGRAKHHDTRNLRNRH